MITVIFYHQTQIITINTEHKSAIRHKVQHDPPIKLRHYTDEYCWPSAKLYIKLRNITLLFKDNLKKLIWGSISHTDTEDRRLHSTILLTPYLILLT